MDPVTLHEGGYQPGTGQYHGIRHGYQLSDLRLGTVDRNEGEWEPVGPYTVGGPVPVTVCGNPELCRVPTLPTWGGDVGVTVTIFLGPDDHAVPLYVPVPRTPESVLP